ncbi:glutathione S-transferase family protein [Paragemmobacter straminiformis]|uniref:Glutathione S-transferase family protein n=1 Tax=Paragemmobacter straminiformis TaxID=2045119 RepID=A0A842IC68_9RHOB|nr:glutathione S-transferase family protein [Gemmobacter straminiformis]MBC2837179.1 glutathione S-transferase family protein [Gemmobacter straminiformis]
MQLVGHYGSPFVRRVGITLHLYAMPFTQSPLGTEDHAALEPLSPLGRIPALVLADGSAITDSSAIIDYLDEQAGDAALTPRHGPDRRRVVALTALALATAEKYVAAYYETHRRPETHVWQPWLDRLNAQIRQGLAALEAQMQGPYLTGDRLTQADVTAIAALDGIRLDMPDLAPRADFPKLFAMLDRLAPTDAFRLTPPA